jgi:putative spermidine/putrescine transport system substrate-binding protein
MSKASKDRPLTCLTTAPQTRRRFLQRTAAAAAAATIAGPAILIPRKARAAGRVVVASYGGTYGEALDAAFFNPFTKETGIEVTQTGIADLAKLKAQVISGSVEWDLIETTQTEVLTANNEGLIQPIDYSIVKMEPDRLVYPQARQPNWVTAFTYTGGIAYNTKTQPGGKHPSTWEEFWDVKNFPGRRGLRSRPNEALEIATMATGVAPKNVYPIDVERAFKSLDRIKPAITKWTENAPQSVQLLQTNELDFSYTYHNRVFGAERSGLPLALSKEQLLIFFNIFAVPTGARSSKEAMQLLNFMMRPDRQAHLCELVGLLPVMKKGVDMVPTALQKAWAPDMSNPKHLVVDPRWWGEPGRVADLTARFKKWMLT